MSDHRIDSVAATLDKADAWFAQLADELGSEDHKLAYRSLRAVLHAIRDRITVDEATDLGAQLPTLVRGIYYEAWSPPQTPSSEHDVFLAHIAEALPPGEDPGRHLAAVMQLLERELDGNVVAHVRGMLPGDLRDLTG